MIGHLQINDVAPRIQYDCDGIQAAFIYPFAVFRAADLEVWRDGVRVTSGFSVSGAGISAGGVVLFAVPPVQGSRLTLRRRVALERISDFQTDGIIRAKTLNDELDYQVAAVQQVADDVSRCLHRPFASASTADLSLPEPAAGRVLKWNAAGDGLENSAADPDALVAAVASHASAAATSAAAAAASVATAADNVAAVVASHASAAAASAVAAADSAAAAADNVVAAVASHASAAAASAAAAAGSAAAAADNVVAAVASHASAAAASAAAAAGSVASAAEVETAVRAQVAIASSKAAEAAASAAAVNLPSTVGHGLSYLRQKAAGDGFEYRTAANVRADIGAASTADVATAATAAATAAAATATATAQQPLRDQIALTNMRLMLNTSVSTGALAAGRAWEFLTDEWAATSSNTMFVAGPPGYYTNNGKTVFSYVGGDQTFVVPTGVTSLTVKLWGAGADNLGAAGAAGGYTTGVLAVTPGETLTVVVGQKGQHGRTTATYGGGGAGGSGGTASAGGGRSAIRRGGADVATAGGAGGAASGDGTASSGVGGGASGAQGYSNGGGGGTQSAGGAIGGYPGSQTAGSQYQGGQGGPGGGGGGGGYYGGGGSNSGGGYYGQGGGGSGFIGTMTGAATTAGTGATPPATGDADYAAGVGIGGGAGVSGGSGNGRVVLSYAVGMRLAVPAAVTLNTAPSFANLYFLWKDESGSLLGTDISVNLSRNGGTTKTAATLTWLSSYDGTYSLIRARADVSGQPVGTSLWGEITTTTKLQRVAAPGLYAE